MSYRYRSPYRTYLFWDFINHYFSVSKFVVDSGKQQSGPINEWLLQSLFVQYNKFSCVMSFLKVGGEETAQHSLSEGAEPGIFLQQIDVLSVPVFICVKKAKNHLYYFSHVFREIIVLMNTAIFWFCFCIMPLALACLMHPNSSSSCPPNDCKQGFPLQCPFMFSWRNCGKRSSQRSLLPPWSTSLTGRKSNVF